MVERTYHVGVTHTDTLTGAPDIVEVHVSAEDEEQAIEFAEMKAEWPNPEFYSDDDVEARQI